MCVSVILSAVYRKDLLPIQLDAIINQTLKPDKVFIWHVEKEDNKLVLPDTKEIDIEVIHTTYDFMHCGRFSLLPLMRTKFISIIDDDVIPGKRWFEECFDLMEKKEAAYGSMGFIPTEINDDYSFIGPGPYSMMGSFEDPVKVDCLGNSYFLKKEWAKYFWQEEPFVWEHIDDLHLGYTLYKYGHIEMYVTPYPEGDKDKWGNISPEYGSKNNPSHKRLDFINKRFIYKYHAIKNGWKFSNDFEIPKNLFSFKKLS